MIHCIYHAGCPDGFASYWAVWQRYGGEVQGHEGRYGQPPPDLPAGADLIIADFSYDRQTMIALAHHCGSLRIFDHHKTALAELDGLEHDLDTETRQKVQIVFDMDRSGAGITWDELFRHDEFGRSVAALMTQEQLIHFPNYDVSTCRPTLIDFVEARDLWQMDRPNVAEIGAFIMTIPHELDAWTEAASRPLSELISRGSGALAQRQQFCRGVEQYSYMADFELEGVHLEDWTMPIVNVSYPIASETAQYLMESAGTDMAAYYFQRADGTWQYGFRSRGDVDVSELAKMFGGGGHRNAAGCQGFSSQIHKRST